MSVPVDEDSGRVRSSVHVLGFPQGLLSFCQGAYRDDFRVKEVEDEIKYLTINGGDLLRIRPFISLGGGHRSPPCSVW